jgi:hypothetical protein
MYYLSAHAHCAEFTEGAILLDLRTGDYLGFDAVALPHLKARVGNWPSVGPGESGTPTDTVSAHTLIRDLLARGILTSVEPETMRPRPALPLMSISTTGCPTALGSVPVSHLVSFIQALFRVPFRARRNRLMPILGWLDRRQQLIHSTMPNLHTLHSLISSFRQLRIWFYTAQDQCLFDSLVLSVFLTLCKLPCTFVIAVAPKPFLAHAWVQVGDMVLNDTAEHAQEFHPLLSVGSRA